MRTTFNPPMLLPCRSCKEPSCLALQSQSEQPTCKEKSALVVNLANSLAMEFRGCGGKFDDTQKPMPVSRHLRYAFP